MLTGRMPTRGNPLHIAQEVLITGNIPIPTNMPSSVTLAYDGSGNLTQMTKVVNSISYIKTFTWTSGNLTGISGWSQI